MASSFHVISLCFLLLISATLAKTSQFKPKALLLLVTKEPKTLQYVTHIKQRTPLVSLSLAIDLGGEYLWTDCDTHGYVSSTYKFYDCHTPQCTQSGYRTFCDECNYPGVGRPGCHNKYSCAEFSLNPFARLMVAGELAADVLFIQSTDGKNPNRVVKVPEFFFFCTDNNNGLLKGLANGVTGIAGLGRADLSLSSQLARFFNYRRVFGVCLSSSKGVIILGEGPYLFHSNVDATSSLKYTPLLVNHGKHIEKPSPDYFIGVKSIKIDGEVVRVNSTLFSFDIDGYGGTKISTATPYTILEPTIYDAFMNAFVSAMSNYTRVSPVEPFEACYNSKNIRNNHLGPVVPVIDLVLQNEEVYWRINGANSMVKVSKDVICLGFLKHGNITPVHAITVGGYQLENNLLHFNVAKSVLGFSSSLFSQRTTCASFNFTSTA